MISAGIYIGTATSTHFCHMLVCAR